MHYTAVDYQLGKNCSKNERFTDMIMFYTYSLSQRFRSLFDIGYCGLKLTQYMKYGVIWKLETWRISGNTITLKSEDFLLKKIFASKMAKFLVHFCPLQLICFVFPYLTNIFLLLKIAQKPFWKLILNPN